MATGTSLLWEEFPMEKKPKATKTRSPKKTPPGGARRRSSSGGGVFRPYFTHRISGETYYAKDYGHRAWPFG